MNGSRYPVWLIRKISDERALALGPHWNFENPRSVYMILEDMTKMGIQIRQLSAKIIASALLLLTAPMVTAGSALDFTIHQEYTSTRALGMGNAFSAVVDDHSALFYNPAALARREDGNLRMFLRGGIDGEYLQLFEDINSASNEGTEAEQNQEIFDLIESHYGDHFYSRAPTLGLVWVRPNWGLAILPVDLSIDIVASRGIGPNLNVSGYLDSTVAYGYARDFKWFGKNRFSVGVTGKAVHRIYTSKQVLAANLVDDSEVFTTADADEGLTFDLDVGTLWSSHRSYIGVKPHFSMVIRNLLDYGFPIQLGLVNENSDQPVQLYRRVDFGSMFELPKLWVFEPKVALDIRDLLHPNWSFEKGYHVGAEMYWRMFNWWKGYWSVGVNQGYISAGFGARLAWFQLDVSTWGEEVGTSSALRESRRYILEMSLDF